MNVAEDESAFAHEAQYDTRCNCVRDELDESVVSDFRGMKTLA